MAKHKRVLVISYFFAPIGGVATERCRKFVKYLPSFGWTPVVLTQALAKVRQLKTREIDESVLDELPSDLKIVRVDGPVLARSSTSTGDGADSASAADGEPPGRRRAGVVALLRRLASLVASPDAFLPWIVPAFFRGLQVMREEDCTVIFATGPSFSAFLLGAVLKLVSGRPLVLDYRDPWGLNDILYQGRKLKQRWNLRLESFCLHRSSRVILATEGFRQIYARHYPGLKDRFTVIRNGYDRDPDPGPPAASAPGVPLRIAYAGKMFGGQYPVEALFRAVHAVVESGGRDCLRLEMAGIISPENQALIETLQLGDIVTLRGHLSRDQVDEMLRCSDGLLLIIGDGYPFLFGLESAKLFEYMSYRKPILGLVPEGGAAWRIIAEHRLGPLARPSDADDIRSALGQLLETGVRASAEAPVAVPDIERFHRRRLTEQLAGIIEALSGA